MVMSPGCPTVEELVAALSPDTDLVRVVRRVCDVKLSYIVVSAEAEEAWVMRDGYGWTRVRDWLAAQSIAVIRISERNGSSVARRT